MKEFIELFQNIAKDKKTAATIKEGLDKAVQWLDKAQEWLSKTPKDEFNKTVTAAREHAREKLANMVREGKINKEYLEKAHRLRMIFPSDFTRKWEEIVNMYYDEYKDEAK
ncbi:MAG: hypothetical protein LBF42_00130 [Puniceicoccales bacterium]|jgi:hypothetical protein|nr:hypothetical protein [Puniceicoccales bacterium]